MRKSISIILIAFVTAARLMANEPDFYTLKYQYRHYLATVNPDGTIFDTLEAEIKTYTAKVLEFTINEKYEIVTYSLTPTDPEPLPFYSDKFCNEKGNIELIRNETPCD